MDASVSLLDNLPGSVHQLRHRGSSVHLDSHLLLLCFGHHLCRLHLDIEEKRLHHARAEIGIHVRFLQQEKQIGTTFKALIELF